MRYTERASKDAEVYCTTMFDEACIVLFADVGSIRLPLRVVREILRMSGKLGITADDPLKPCPFCGNALELVLQTQNAETAVRCDGCGTCGPVMMGACEAARKTEAAQAWNLRAGEPA